MRAEMNQVRPKLTYEDKTWEVRGKENRLRLKLYNLGQKYRLEAAIRRKQGVYQGDIKLHSGSNRKSDSKKNHIWEV